MSFYVFLVLAFSWLPNLLTGWVEAPTTPTNNAWQIYLPVVAKQPTINLWMSREQLKALPTSGTAWERLKEKADEAAGTPTLSDQDSDTGVRILAKALVYGRTDQASYRAEVSSAIEVITFGNTEDGGRTLALGRNLVAYVIAADLIDLGTYNPALDLQFRTKLRTLLTKPLEGWGSQRTLQQTHELRANNWGTTSGASRIAVALYLGDRTELDRSAQVFRGYLGDLSAYNNFDYDDDLSWQADPGHPVGINPVGATKDGHSIDGALPEEMRRGGPFQWPPLETNYPWGALQGAVVQAALLQQAGYPAWEWQDKALLRAVQFLYNIGWPAEGDDEWIMPLINCVYHANFPVVTPAQQGKNVGWTDWTHGQCS